MVQLPPAHRSTPHNLRGLSQYAKFHRGAAGTQSGVRSRIARCVAYGGEPKGGKKIRTPASDSGRTCAGVPPRHHPESCGYSQSHLAPQNQGASPNRGGKAPRRRCLSPSLKAPLRRWKYRFPTRSQRSYRPRDRTIRAGQCAHRQGLCPVVASFPPTVPLGCR